MKKTDFPEPSLTLVEMLRARAADSPDHTAFTCLAYDRKGREAQSCLTYRELDQKARSLAVYLKTKGPRKGDRTLIFYTQSLDNIVSIYGTLYAGGAFILNPPPIDSGKQERFHSVLESDRPKYLLCNSAVSAKMQQSFSQKATESLATLQYSSGSTAAPKGCKITHRNLLTSLENIAHVSNLRVPMTFVNFTPFFHNMGLFVGVFASTRCCGHSVIMSPLDFMERPLRWLELITRFRARVTVAPNSAYQLLAKVVRQDERYMVS